MTLGKRIRELRGDIPQTKLARRAGVSRAALIAWELDESVPSLTNAAALAKALNVSLTELAQEQPPVEEAS